METRAITVDQLMAWRPCFDEKTGAYGRPYVEKLWAGREALTALDILALDIPINDRFWAAIRPELIDDVTLRLWAADCAEHVLHLFESKRPDDKRPHLAIEAARAYARGIISLDELRAAEAAAWAAAGAAAWAAAGAAAWAAAGAAAQAAAGAAARAAAGAAARAAAGDAAEAAAWAAAGDAAWAAAGAAAGAAEQQWQVDRLCAYLRGEVPQS